MEKKTEVDHHDIVKGSCFALLAFFFIALFGMLTKIALQGGSVIWVSFLVYLTCSLLLIPFVLKNGLSSLKSEHYYFLLARAVFGTAASFIYSISMYYIPIVNATLLFNSAPVFIPILMTVFLKKKIGKSTWFAVLLGFIGITIIIHPTSALFTQTGNFIGLLSGLMLAIAFIFLKLLVATDTPLRIVFWYLGIGTLMQLPLIFFTEHLPTTSSFFYSILAGICMVTGQLLLVRAYKYAEASEIGVYQYASVVFVGLFDFLLFAMVPTASAIFGTMLVAVAGIMIIRNSANKTAKKS